MGLTNKETGTELKYDRHKQFAFEGEVYEIDPKYVESGLPIVLPDGTLVQITSVLESLPPQIGQVEKLEAIKAKKIE